MKIMSFNTQHCLNYIERKIDYEVMAKAILDCNADIVGLNEMRGAPNGEPDPAFEDQVGNLSKLTGIENYHFAPAIWVGGYKPYGNGMLSKLPIISAETVMIPDPDEKIFGSHYETRCVLKQSLRAILRFLLHTLDSIPTSR